MRDHLVRILLIVFSVCAGAGALFAGTGHSVQPFCELAKETFTGTIRPARLLAATVERCAAAPVAAGASSPGRANVSRWAAVATFGWQYAGAAQSVEPAGGGHAVYDALERVYAAPGALQRAGRYRHRYAFCRSFTSRVRKCGWLLHQYAGAAQQSYG